MRTHPNLPLYIKLYNFRQRSLHQLYREFFPCCTVYVEPCISSASFAQRFDRTIGRFKSGIGHWLFRLHWLRRSCFLDGRCTYWRCWLRWCLFWSAAAVPHCMLRDCTASLSTGVAEPQRCDLEMLGVERKLPSCFQVSSSFSGGRM